MTRMEEVRQGLKAHYEAIRYVIDVFVDSQPDQNNLHRELTEFAERLDMELTH